MKNSVIVLLCCLTFYVSFGQQQATEALQDNYTLRERYGVMKSKSQTFKDYKVIKESVLDGVWRIMLDSVNAKQASINQFKRDIDTLKTSLSRANAALKQKEESMAETLHASTHISVIGIDLPKGAFLTIVGIVLAALILLVVSVFARMKLLSKSVQERKLAVNLITNDYEEYKRKAMEKQMKLSRELQDERNKQSMRNG